MSYQKVNDVDIEMRQTGGGSSSQEEAPASKPTSNRFLIGFFVTFAVVAMLYSVGSSYEVPGPAFMEESTLDTNGAYVMKDFDKRKPMANFLNGIGGVWGIPMWAFYVNRGQGITSFGKQNKDNAIMKFDTAEKAYQSAAFSGFRTFLKATVGGKSWTHMPFFPIVETKVTREMKMGKSEMEIQEVAPELGLQTNVVYFTSVDEEFATFVRSATFTNLNSEDMEVEVLDGLGKLIPSGLSNGGLEGMGRTMEAWMNVYNTGSSRSGGSITEPFFHISQDPADTAQVKIIKDGHFVVSFVEGLGEKVEQDGLHAPLPFIVDPSLVYEFDTTLTDPSGFFGKSAPALADLVKQPQGTTSRTPCSFAGTKLTIPAGKSVTISSIYGHADDLATFVGSYSPKLRTPGYIAKKRKDGLALVEDIYKKVQTKTNSALFDAYVAQDFLDNALRGGLPMQLGEENPKTFHVFSRIHGDIERDYNFFQIDTTYFSQGPGNFRDVSQNRRLDVLHSPEVKDFNLHMFLSFVQADGYNPLTVASTNFRVPEADVEALLPQLGLDELSGSKSHKSAATIMTDLLTKAFRPGQLFQSMKDAGITISMDREQFINKVIDVSVQDSAAVFAQNAFWSDHWTYTLDLVENYLMVYPDKEESMLWEGRPVPFFMSPASVKPRSERYELVQDPTIPGKATIAVFHALSIWGEPTFSAKRSDALVKINSDSFVDGGGAGGLWQRSADFKVFHVSAAAKLFMLGTIKFSTLDPMGMGIEMEGGKPGWNDAMNGLPGIVGSGMPETYEMLKIIEYVNAAVGKYKRSVTVPHEYGVFMTTLVEALDTFDASEMTSDDQFVFWDASNTAREVYRAATDTNFSGKVTELSASSVVSMLEKMITKTKSGINAAVKANHGLSPTYFYYECSDYSIAQPLNADGDSTLLPSIAAKSFKQHSLPMFLEGPSRHLKVVDDIEERRKIAQRVKTSGLYDEKLKMYTISESLAGMSPQIGRMMAFSAGWLENQSVWLHMSYKYYLELLRGGLYEEFFEEISTGLVPFMDNKVYGRSPLEAASFIVSSAFPDAKLHGASFLARLSGSTAEMLSIWAHMMFGPSPFSLDESGELQLVFAPVLPSYLFTDAGTVSTTFLGEVEVTYKNPSKIDTWKIAQKSASVTHKDGTVETVDGAVFGSELAKKIRSRDVASITVEY